MDHYSVNYKEGSVIGYFLECSKCEKKILVEMILFGPPHHQKPSATCAECLEVMERFRKEQPKITEQIESWAKESDE